MMLDASMRLDMFHLGEASWLTSIHEDVCFICALTLIKVLVGGCSKLLVQSYLRLRLFLKDSWIVVVLGHLFVVETVPHADLGLVFNERVLGWVSDLSLGPRRESFGINRFLSPAILQSLLPLLKFDVLCANCSCSRFLGVRSATQRHDWIVDLALIDTRTVIELFE